MTVKPAKSGMSVVDFVDLGGPPGFHRRVERIVGGETADFLRAGDVHAHGETHAPWAHRVGDSGDALEVVGIEKRRGSVHVVDVAAVDADRGQQARVFGDGREVVADVAALEEDAAACIAALDGAVGVVPLIDPADRHGGVLAQVGPTQVSALREVAQQRKGAVEHTAVAAADDIDLADEVAAALRK